MSYNCDTWKTKRLDNLKIPIAALYKHPRKDWHPERIAIDDKIVEFKVTESCYVMGIVEGEILNVADIQCWGEGSGTAMNWIFEPALQESTGILKASCVWEGGDCINRLTVKDGKVTWKDLEI